MVSTLPVVENFHSLQGEGAHAGRSAFFIRLASCKVGCTWCDTKESWNPKNYPQKSINELTDAAYKAWKKGANFIVITGGEPLHHNLNNLCHAIRSKASIPIHLETSGVDSISGNPNWISLSPKHHAPPKDELLAACQELKVIIHSTADLKFAEQMAKAVKKYQKKALFFLQPGWNTSLGQELAINHVLANPEWRLSLQTHKWLNLR